MGRDRGGVGRNRWREFMTGRFYGEFQEDLIAARFDRAGGLAVEDDAKDGETEREETPGKILTTTSPAPVPCDRRDGPGRV